ncbi:MAG: NAD-dependent epimerase/dehydratase family protein [Nanoarchaeota archaeon]
MKKVIVTGGLGFIGSHLINMLLEKNVEVIIVDNKITNVIDDNFFNDKCQIISKSIKEVDFNDFKDIDVVFHLASILGPSGVLKHAGDLGKSILDDSIKIRDYCMNNNILMIDISTSEVYGHPDLLKEDSKKVFPGIYQIRTEYGAGKMLSEIALVNKARVDERLNFHLIRPFNVTGPRQKPDGGFVLPRFVISALTNQPLTVFGDGTQRRAFTHVKDICEAVLEIADSKHKNEIWNIGNPNNEMSIKEMAELVAEKVKEKFPEKNPEIIFIDPKKIHGPHFAEAIDKVPYVEKINKLLGWEAKRLAEKIILDVIDYYDKRIKEGYYFDVMGKLSS